MLNVKFSLKEISILARLASGYRKSQEGQRSNKAEWARKLEEKLLVAETEAMEVMTINLKKSYEPKNQIPRPLLPRLP